ncbi:Rdx family protein [Campylobacter curvus]|nr:Rdx family protein [Campylobacter curvus]UEB50835.1 Rdx family protein [Campylobacter curvus]
MKKNFGDARVDLVIGDGGNFIVEVDGDVIFSKKDRIGNDEARFPHGEEITRLINKHLGRKTA